MLDFFSRLPPDLRADYPILAHIEECLKDPKRRFTETVPVAAFAVSGAPPLKAKPPCPSRLPKSEFAQRLAKLFNRRLTTEWNDKEIEAFRKVALYVPDDMTLLERYYAHERAKGDGKDGRNGGIHRRDLLTFLNNYTGELDRARAWQAVRDAKVRPSSPKVVQMPPPDDPELRAKAVAAMRETAQRLNGGVA